MVKKGQGALEYLMTYGWALLVIVIVVAALYAMGVLNPASYTQSTATGFQYFKLAGSDVQLTNSTLKVVVQNGPKDITITGISFGGTALTLSSTAVSAGKTATLSPTGDPTTKNTDASYSETLILTYDVTGGLTGNKDSGTVSGKVQ